MASTEQARRGAFWDWWRIVQNHWLHRASSGGGRTLERPSPKEQTNPRPVGVGSRSEHSLYWTTSPHLTEVGCAAQEPRSREHNHSKRCAMMYFGISMTSETYDDDMAVREYVMRHFPHY